MALCMKTTQFQTPTANIPHRQTIQTAKACAIPQLSNKQRNYYDKIKFICKNTHKFGSQINHVIFELFQNFKLVISSKWSIFSEFIHELLILSLFIIQILRFYHSSNFKKFIIYI